MSDNHHHEYAQAAFTSANAEADPTFNAAVRTDAQIQATLALAYEQRTANLIALYSDNDIGLQVDISHQDLAEQIKERLGL